VNKSIPTKTSRCERIKSLHENGLLALRSGRKAMATKKVAHRLIRQPIT